jgi:hypothetical protein
MATKSRASPAVATLVFHAAMAIRGTSAYTPGHSSCPCMRSSSPHGIREDDSQDPSTVHWLQDYMYDVHNYGDQYGLECMAHDANKAPSCNVSSPPSWCSDPWCYVDQDTCELKATPSSYLPGVRLVYSYQTCSPGVHEQLTKDGTKNFLGLLVIAVSPAILAILLLVVLPAAARAVGVGGGAGSGAGAASGGAAPSSTFRDLKTTDEQEKASFTVARTTAVLERALRADQQLSLRLTSITICLAWVLIFLGIGPTFMFDFDIIKDEAVLPPAMGNRGFYRDLFPPGLCILVLAIRPADRRAVWAVTAMVASALFIAAPIWAWLAAVWYGPENPTVAFGNEGARILNGGDPAPATGYLALALVCWGASAFLMYPIPGYCLSGRCGVAMPSRLVLKRLWRVVRVLLFTFSLVLLAQDVYTAYRNPRYATSSLFVAKLLFCSIAVACAAAATPFNRRWVISVLGRCAANGEERSLAALSTIIGNRKPKLAVEAAAQSFRALPFSKMSLADWETNADTGLNAHVVPVAPGGCDAFVTHSWSDPGAIKWERLCKWRDEFAAAPGGHADPVIWLDKACIDQKNIKGSLTGLPMYVAWSKTLLLLASSSYVKRLWCMMELFTWVQMGCPIDRITIADIDGGASLDQDLLGFRVKNAKCYVRFDKHRLLAVIENAFCDHESFEGMVREVMQVRRGRADTLESFNKRRRSSTLMSTRDERESAETPEKEVTYAV